MKIARHPGNDWCHLCGLRQDHLADVWFPENAEHGGSDSRYIRVCAVCGKAISSAGTGGFSSKEGEVGT